MLYNNLHQQSDEGFIRFPQPPVHQLLSGIMTFLESDPLVIEGFQQFRGWYLLRTLYGLLVPFSLFPYHAVFSQFQTFGQGLTHDFPFL